MENKTIRIATNGVTGELRNMEVGETVRFPFDKYNPSSVRSAASALYVERMNGKKWSTQTNCDEWYTDVTRIS